MEAAPSWATEMQSNINSHTDETVGKLRKDVEKQFVTVNGRMDGIEVKYNSLAERMKQMEQGASQNPGGSFKPKYVDVKNFCEWKDKAANGIDRTEAAKIYQALKATLTPDLQDKVGEFSLRSSKNNSMRVPIEPTVIDEIRNSWNDHLKAPSNNYKGRELFVTSQRPPEEDKRYAALGKVTDFVESEIDHTYNVRTFWKPDFQVVAECDDKHPIFIAAVLPDSSVVWDPIGIKTINKESSEIASAALLKFRRGRR